MNTNLTLNRRDLLQSLLSLPTFAALFAATITVSCADDSGSSSGSGDVNGTIGDNHGHSVTITEAELDAGDAVTLTLTTGLGHTHTAELNAQEVQDIADGTEVVVESSTASSDNHSHTVTFSNSSGGDSGGPY